MRRLGELVELLLFVGSLVLIVASQLSARTHDPANTLAFAVWAVYALVSAIYIRQVDGR